MTKRVRFRLQTPPKFPESKPVLIRTQLDECTADEFVAIITQIREETGTAWSDIFLSIEGSWDEDCEVVLQYERPLSAPEWQLLVDNYWVKKASYDAWFSRNRTLILDEERLRVQEEHAARQTKEAYEAQRLKEKAVRLQRELDEIKKLTEKPQ